MVLYGQNGRVCPFCLMLKLHLICPPWAWTTNPDQVYNTCVFIDLLSLLSTNRSHALTFCNMLSFYCFHSRQSIYAADCWRITTYFFICTYCSVSQHILLLSASFLVYFVDAVQPPVVFSWCLFTFVCYESEWESHNSICAADLYLNENESSLLKPKSEKLEVANITFYLHPSQAVLNFSPLVYRHWLMTRTFEFKCLSIRKAVCFILLSEHRCKVMHV